jgi:CheY-like chemotaxis protein
MHVLVVDDNRDTADALAWVLQSLGHEARSAYDGPAALLAVVRNAPDVIIQDLGLPHMNGYEIARRMRELSAARRSLLVAVSGLPRAQAMRMARQADFDHFLAKPVGLAALERVLRACAAGHRRFGSNGLGLGSDAAASCARGTGR